jgi:hypothetical protein
MGGVMTEKTANKIYDILVEHAGASESMRQTFVYDHTNPKLKRFLRVTEWRFQGKLGFGGKLWIDGNRIYIDCYQEDEDKEKLDIIKKVNELLKEFKPED